MESWEKLKAQTAELQLRLDVGWVVNCPVAIKQKGERAVAKWKANQILILFQNWFKQAGYVQLDPNQNLPKNPYSATTREPIRDVEGYQVFTANVPAMREVTSDGHIGYAEGQQDMLKAGFKKVKEE